MQEVAALCDDIVIISHGRVVVRGTPAEILAATGAADLEEHSCAPPTAVWPHDARNPDRLRQGNAREPARPARDPVGVPVRRAARAGDLRPDDFAGVEARGGEPGQALQLSVAGSEHAPNLVHFSKRTARRSRPSRWRRTSDQPKCAPARKSWCCSSTPSTARKLQAASRRRSISWSTPANQQTGRAPIVRGVCSKRTAVSWHRCACSCAASARRSCSHVDVRTLDVATPAGRSLLILGMMTYFSFMSMLVGGFYLAIDTTAGERERGSLEPLLGCR
jgi:hypothetical protein